MTEEQYTTRRAQLVKEFWFNKSKRCYLVARARIRKIADLDYEFKGIDREVTKQKFSYNNLK
jgi:hypothetical protein